jgi:hypothetical protein
MATTPARERIRKSRRRRRLGLRPVQVELSEQVIDFLLARKYELERTDNASIGQASIVRSCSSTLEPSGPLRMRLAMRLREHGNPTTAAKLDMSQI